MWFSAHKRFWRYPPCILPLGDFKLEPFKFGVEIGTPITKNSFILPQNQHTQWIKSLKCVAWCIHDASLAGRAQAFETWYSMNKSCHLILSLTTHEMSHWLQNLNFLLLSTQRIYSTVISSSYVILDEHPQPIGKCTASKFHLVNMFNIHISHPARVTLDLRHSAGKAGLGIFSLACNTPLRT
jgi:hypothetical protein